MMQEFELATSKLAACFSNLINHRSTTMLKISNSVEIPLSEIEFEAIRAQGAGGQHVNKVSSAMHLRFDISNSTLPAFYKEKLLAFADQRITNDGVIIIKAQKFRSQDKNRDDALERLKLLIKKATVVQKKRKATKPSRNSQRKRMDSKNKHGKLKSLRKRIDY